jgi:type IV secretory pathway VirB2 component (pilin)
MTYNDVTMPDRRNWKGGALERYDSGRTRFSWVKLSLFLLSIAYDAAVLWTIILLVTGRISNVSGIVLLVVAVTCSLSGKSLWRRSKVGIGAVVLMLCAFSGIEPFVSVKNLLATWINDAGTWMRDRFIAALEYLRGLLPAKK